MSSAGQKVRIVLIALPMWDAVIDRYLSCHNTPARISEVPVPHCIAGVTIMLSITIFATIVGEMLPVTDATPLIGLETLEKTDRDHFFCTL